MKQLVVMLRLKVVRPEVTRLLRRQQRNWIFTRWRCSEGNRC
jgi:hypothetical protein